MSRICPACGTEGKDGSAFCENCGHRLDEAAAAAAVAAPAVPEPAPVSPEPASAPAAPEPAPVSPEPAAPAVPEPAPIPPEPAPAPGRTEAPAPAPQPEKKKKKNGLYVLLALVGLLLIGVSVIGMLKSGRRTVTFDTGGGTQVASVTLKKGEAVSRPSDPVKEDFDFTGWYLNGKEYDFGSPVVENITLEAGWKPAVYVTFMAAGKEVARERAVDGHVTFPEPPAVDGYAFVEWQDADTAVIGEDYVFTEDTVVTAYYKVYVPVASIKFKSDAYTIERGSTLKPALLIEPYNWVEPITFHSSDQSVAIVAADGTIHAMDPGTVVITVQTESGKSASATVTVTAPCSYLHFKNSEISLPKGGKALAELEIEPADTTDAVTFSTSNKNVAKVDAEGNITAVGYGTATITAKCGAQTATMTVKVENPATDISTADRFDVYVGDVFYINAKTVPEDSTSKIVSYTTSDSQIALVNDEGKVTAIRGGYCYVTVKTDNGITKLVHIYVDQYTLNISLELPSGVTPYYLFYQPSNRPVIKVHAELDVIHNGYHTPVPLTSDQLEFMGKDKVLTFYDGEIYVTGYGTNAYGFMRQNTKTVWFRCEYNGKLISSEGFVLTVEPMLEISCPNTGCTYTESTHQLNLPSTYGEINFQLLANLKATAKAESGASITSTSFPTPVSGKPAYTRFDCQYYKTYSSAPGRIIIRTEGGQEITVDVR